jgi:hypothetical protein
MLSTSESNDEARWTMVRDRLQHNERQRARQLFDERVASLFERLPMLSGFWVDDDLSTTEAQLYTWPGWDPSAQVAEEIDRELHDLLDERPDAAELLRGRTFARSLQ